MIIDLSPDSYKPRGARCLAIRLKSKVIHERDVDKSVFHDRWSKDLIASHVAGFSLGIAQYHSREFGTPQVHEDQEAIYVVSGVGEMHLDDEIVHVEAGMAIYVPAGCRHAARVTGDQPLNVVYAHASSYGLDRLGPIMM